MITASGLSRHTFVGGNAFMVRLMNRYRAELGVEATPAEMEATARATVRQLEADTATVTIERAAATDGALAVDVVVKNLTGHKFPTGYPSRRAWLHLTVNDGNGRTLFESGRMTDAGLIEGNNSDADGTAFEPHTNRSPRRTRSRSTSRSWARRPTCRLQASSRRRSISKTTDCSREVSTRRRRRSRSKSLAVRRLTRTSRATAIVSRYRLAVTGAATVEVELRYQPIGYRWAQNLASYQAAESRRFVGYYNSLAAYSSVVVARASRAIAP